ncbi:MAG TPA: zinc ribbon domain-containing protein [Thermoplasmata archaeon]|nr:zinc ribbon domain-containing protein [Thermoplasmata archaeon]
MSRVRPPPRYARSGAANARSLAVVALGVLLLAGSALIAPASRAPSSVIPGSGDSGSTLLIAGAAPACGTSPFAPNDLIVRPGAEPCVFQSSGPGTTYTQSGNVTVLPGGVLIIRNITFSIQQFVSDTGTPMQRLSHIYSFRDEGSVQFWNATLTTAATGSDPYLKLHLNITGQMTVWNSSFEFPGWIDVYGPSASLTLNESTIEANPAANSTAYQSLGPTIVADTSYAPSLSAQNGAQLMLLNSTCKDVYADDTQTSANGMPGPLPLTSTLAFQISPGSGRRVTSFSTPTASINLLQDWLYPTGIYSGYVEITYTSITQVSTVITVDYNGTPWPLNSISFGPGSEGATAVIPLSSALVGSINQLGMLQYLNLTGAFAGTSPGISIDFGATAFGTANISEVDLVLLPRLVYDFSVTGDGSRLTAGDTTLGINWNRAPSSPVSLSSPYPWDSNKLLLEHGATALLASLVIPTPNPGASATSAILPDSSSNAYLFRWAAFPVAGRGGIPVPDARALAYYAIGGGATNATVNALNDLGSSNRILWGYVQSWDSAHGISTYGVTSTTDPGPGVAFLLLVSVNVTAATLPSGVFLGSYNAKIVPPLTGVATASFSFSLTPYPQGLTNASPDRAPTTSFPEYAAGLSIGSLSYTVDGVPSTATAHIGQTLGVQVPIRNTGTAPVVNLSATMAYQSPSGGSIVVSTLPLTNESIPSNGTFTIDLAWNLSESVIGANGAFSATLAFALVWNGGSSIGDGGSAGTTAPIGILPSYVRILTFQAYPSTLRVDSNYTSVGTISFNGSGRALIELIATPAGGAGFVLAETNASAGTFNLTLSSSRLVAGVVYTLSIEATYNTASAPVYGAAGTVSLGSEASSASSFTLWLGIAIGVAIIVAVLLLVLLLRRGRTSETRECGECGTLVAAGEQTCPRCGTWFETKPVPCPSCGAAIPADVGICPECATEAPDRPTVVQASEGERQAYEEFVSHYRAAAAGELGEDYPEAEFWAWWKLQPSYYSFRAWRKREERDSHPVDPPVEPEPSDEELF